MENPKSEENGILIMELIHFGIGDIIEFTISNLLHIHK